MSGRVVLVTFELYPLTAGGIGRAIFNIMLAVPVTERERITVVVVGSFDHPPRIPFELSGFDIRFANVNDERGLTDGEATYPPRWAYDNTEWHWRSFTALRALREIERHEPIAYVEFPDWGGLGYCTVQEKKTGLGFLDTQIAVRLHGPHGVLLCTERYAVTENDLNIFDIERKALRDCDTVIAQTQPYFEKVAEVFGFSSSEWESKCFYSPPPVLVDSTFETGWRRGSGEKYVVFASKFQHIKRPELFVRGVSEFLSSEVGSEWKAVFCAHITDVTSKQRVVSQIPQKLLDRFEFRTGVSGAERDHLIAHSVVVISSACESYCLAAFEASLLGALVILNEENPSFGEGTLWKDGVNCLKFDGSASSLASALKRAALGEAQTGVIAIPPFVPPWREAKRSWLEPKKRAKSKGVSIVIYGADTALQLSRTMRNIASSRHSNIELIVTLAGQGGGDRQLLQEKIEAASNPRIKLVSNSEDSSVGASLNRAVGESSFDQLFFVRAGDLLHSSFVGRASVALQREELDAVMSQVGYFDPNSPPDIHSAQGYLRYGVTSGEAWLATYLRNRSGSRPFAIKRSVLDRAPFNEELHDGVMWYFWRRMSMENRRLMVFNSTYAFCDMTSPEEFSSALDRSEAVLGYHEILQTTSDMGNGAKYLLMSHAMRTMVHMDSQLKDADFGTRRGTTTPSQVSEALAELHGLIDRVHASPGGKSRWRITRLLQRVRSRGDFEFLRTSGLFDAPWYLSKYPDVAASGVDPLKHYLIHGGFEGRYPNRHFDSASYLAANPDVAEARMNPLVHYVLHGKIEGRLLR